MTNQGDYLNLRRHVNGSEEDPTGHRVDLQSGFVVMVNPLPPYYADIIEGAIPMPDYPAREIHLASGDVVDWPYEPSEEEPSPEDDDYELWIKWHDVDRRRKEVEERRKRVRNDFLLTNCLEIIEGPIEFDNENWVYRVEGAFQEENYKVPSHPGARFLVFLKTQVIKSSTEFEMLVSLSVSQEVSMQGILDALRGFQGGMGQGGSDRGSEVFPEG